MMVEYESAKLTIATFTCPMRLMRLFVPTYQSNSLS